MTYLGLDKLDELSHVSLKRTVLGYEFLLVRLSEQLKGGETLA